jgi:protein-S-isoprenylcysteine O-methyltransferase Ste14
MSSVPIRDYDLGTRSGRLRLLWEVAANLFLSLLFFKFLLDNGREFLGDHRLSTLLLMAKVGGDMVFFLIRRLPREVSVSPYDWTVGIVGTFAMTLMRPEGPGADLAYAQAVQLFGMGLQVAGILSLNTSFGITAANRGVKTGGMYRVVRHPLYMSYVISCLGYVLNHPTPHNLAVYVAAIGFWVLRILAEERLLKKDPAYAEYATKTPWRMVPFVF